MNTNKDISLQARRMIEIETACTLMIMNSFLLILGTGIASLKYQIDIRSGDVTHMQLDTLILGAIVVLAAMNFVPGVLKILNDNHQYQLKNVDRIIIRKAIANAALDIEDIRPNLAFLSRYLTAERYRTSNYYATNSTN